MEAVSAPGTRRFVSAAAASAAAHLRVRGYPGWLSARRATWALLNAIRQLASWRRARWFSRVHAPRHLPGGRTARPRPLPVAREASAWKPHVRTRADPLDGD
jgi:hypothetical protein